MNLTRYVPLEGALMAAGKAMDEQTKDGPCEDWTTFRDWFNDYRPSGKHHGVIDYPALTIEEVEDLLPSVPDTIAGRAWKQVVEKSLAKTKRVTPRSYDLATFDTPAELAIISEIDEFAEELRETSPLLDEVADTISGFAYIGPTALGDIREERTRIRNDEFVVGDLHSSCEKHEECIEGHVLRTVKWAHIDAVAFPDQPGLARDTVVRLLTALDAHLPAPA